MRILIAAFGLFVMGACASIKPNPMSDPPGPKDAIALTLNALHDAAAKADEKRYFDLYAPNAVFLGTDAKERWTLDQFKAFAHPYFAKGKAWTYIPIKGTRHVTIEGRGQDVAWFDEQLQNAKLGVCRGSGVLVLVGGEWKIKQYNLTMLVPNEIAEHVADESRSELQKAGTP